MYYKLKKKRAPARATIEIPRANEVMAEANRFAIALHFMRRLRENYYVVGKERYLALREEGLHGDLSKAEGELEAILIDSVS